MTRKLSLPFVAAVSGALLLGACEQSDDQAWQASGPTRICTDRAGARVADNQCAVRPHGAGGNAFLWYYLGTLGRRSYVPAYGGRVSGGSYSPAAGVSYRAPVSIARGGFGESAHAFGGVGE